MRRRILGLVSFGMTVAFGLAGPLAAQTQDGRYDLELRGGFAAPAGELLELVDPGPSFGASFAYFVTPRIAFQARGGLDLLPGVEADAAGPAAPNVDIWHFTAGPLVRVIVPDGTRWIVDLYLGGGFTTLDADRFRLGRTRIDFTETYFTVNGGLQVGYDVSRNATLFAAADAYLIATDKKDTRVFGRLRADVDPEGFSTAWTFPFTAGFAVRLP